MKAEKFLKNENRGQEDQHLRINTSAENKLAQE
jgi:hypothetical protein